MFALVGVITYGRIKLLFDVYNMDFTLQEWTLLYRETSHCFLKENINAKFHVTHDSLY